MNFRIIDGNDDYLQKLPEFVEAYNSNQLTIPELKRKLNLTPGEYRKLRKHSIEENLIKLKKRGGRKKKETYKTNPKHYSSSMTKGRYYWQINHHGTYYCNLKTEAQAQEMVRRLRACNWDKTRVPEFKAEIMKTIK